MYSKQFLQNAIAFDIETVSEFKDLKTLKTKKPRLGELWDKRCVYLKNKHEDNIDLSNEEIYKQKAGLQAEYGKIVCISIAYLRYGEDNIPVIKAKSFASKDEGELLNKFFTFLNGAKEKLPNAVYAGHNVLEFDIPFIFKRALINGLSIPDIFNMNGKKPWEINIVDTIKVFANGSWKEGYTPLATLATILGIPSPKDDIDGSDVSRVFWEDGDLTRISKYCEKDVFTVINVLIKFANFEPVDDFISVE